MPSIILFHYVGTIFRHDAINDEEEDVQKKTYGSGTYKRRSSYKRSIKNEFGANRTIPITKSGGTRSLLITKRGVTRIHEPSYGK